MSSSSWLIRCLKSPCLITGGRRQEPKVLPDLEPQLGFKHLLRLTFTFHLGHIYVGPLETEVLDQAIFLLVYLHYIQSLISDSKSLREVQSKGLLPVGEDTEGHLEQGHDGQKPDPPPSAPSACW